MAGTRERIVETGAELFRRNGYAGTGVKQIVEQANAPFGSLYHFFPGGKVELAEQVIHSSGALYMELFARIASETPDVPSGVAAFFAGAAETLEQTDYADACPIATVALEVASSNERLRQASAEVFGDWLAGASAYFQLAGISSGRARELALTMLSLLEGAFLFSRVLRSVEPMAIAGAAAVSAVQEALEQADSPN